MEVIGFLSEILLIMWEIIKVNLTWVYVILERIYRIFIPRNLKSLDGEIILLTGAGNGIGKMMAHELCNVGAKALILWDIETGANERTAKELKSQNSSTNIYAYTVDITNQEQVQNTASIIRQEIGDVTIIFNNAGIVPVKNFLKSSPESLTKIFDINVFSHFWILREFLPKMIEINHGHIVTTASIVSFAPSPFIAAYSASKHSVYAFIESLQQELWAMPTPTDNIKFTNIYPTAVGSRALNGIEILSSYDFAKVKVTPGYIAQKAVEGFRQNYEHLYLPPAIQIMAIMSAILPTPIFHYILYDILKAGVRVSEDYFTPGLDEKQKLTKSQEIKSHNA